MMEAPDLARSQYFTLRRRLMYWISPISHRPLSNGWRVGSEIWRRQRSPELSKKPSEPRERVRLLEWGHFPFTAVAKLPINHSSAVITIISCRHRSMRLHSEDLTPRSVSAWAIPTQHDSHITRIVAINMLIFIRSAYTGLGMFTAITSGKLAPGTEEIRIY